MELILVVVVLGLLVITALPKFLNASADARQSSRKQVVGSIRTAITMVYGKNLAYGFSPSSAWPATLDQAGMVANSACNTSGRPCFVGVAPNRIMANGISDKDWTYLAANEWSHTDGATTCTYTYNAATGAFTGAVTSGSGTCP